MLERFDKETGNWAKVTSKLITDLEYSVLGLIQGKQYAFRVSTVNLAGLSKPCKASDSITAESPKSNFSHYH